MNAVAGPTSALAAVFLRDGGSVSRERVASLSAALRPFGNYVDLWRGGSEALIRRADRSPAARAPEDRQPTAAGDGSLILFAGFLSHRDELAGALRLPPGDTARQSDSALFARAWTRWGRDAVGRVDGEFAVVVWDRPARTLVAACSPWAAPPLCFHVNRRRAVVATAPRGVFGWGDLARRLDDERLSNCLIGHHGDPRRTYYRDVLNLLPGEMLTVTPEAHDIRRYHDPVAPVRPPRPTANYVEEARHRLREAVRDALCSPELPAILLSGGLDSPAVAVTALEILAESPTHQSATLLSFTSHPEPDWDGRAPENRSGDERPLVRELAARYPALDIRFVDAAGLGFDHRLEQTIALAEVPPRNVGNLVWIHESLRTARTAGRRVVLGGDSGNLTLSLTGQERLAELLGTARLRELRHAVGPFTGRSVRSLLRHALPWLPPLFQRAVLRRLGAPVAMPPPFSAIHRGYARTTRLAERARAQAFGPYRPLPRSLRESQLLGLTSPIRQGDGRAVMWALKTLHGVALRDPLGEGRLVESCLGMPGEQFFDRGRPRLLIRQLLRGRVPPAFLSAPRGLQAADWHLRYTRALPRIRETLGDWRHDPAVAERLDLDRLLRLVDTWPAKTPLSARDHPEFRLARTGLGRALAAGTFIRWVERGYEQAPPDETAAGGTA